MKNLFSDSKCKYESYDKNEIDDLVQDVYSTTEALTNKVWGTKPVYRKIIETGAISSTSKTVNHNISNIDKIIKLEGMCFTSDYSITIPRVLPTTLDGQVGLYASSTQIVIQAGSDASFTDSFVVIEYTKTENEGE